MSDTLGDRMKRYERASNYILPARLPVLLRLDGRAFHTFTRGMEKPFDNTFISAMKQTAYSLCRHITGAKFAYVQSDEISILLTNNDYHETQPWFDGEVSKIVSVAAGYATVCFNHSIPEEWKGKLPHFDARVFVIPSDDVVNYFIWRQRDWTRNSLNMFARSFYSQKQLQGKNAPLIHDMLHAQGANWNTLATHLKRGSAVIRNGTGWKVDEEMPILTENRDYVPRTEAKE